MNVHRGVLGLVALATPLALVACRESEGTGEVPSGDSVATAAKATQDADTARFTLSFEDTGSDGAVEPNTLEGAVDFRRHLVVVSSEIDRMIVDETHLYVAAIELQGDRWLEYDLTKAPNAVGQPPEFVPDMFFGRLDPILLLAFLQRSSGSFERIGEERIDGVATTKYRGYRESEVLVAELVSPALQDVAILDEWDTRFYVDAWISEDGRLRRVVYDFPTSNVLFGRRSTVEFYDFGARIDVEAPRAEEVIDQDGEAGSG